MTSGALTVTNEQTNELNRSAIYMYMPRYFDVDVPSCRNDLHLDFSYSSCYRPTPTFAKQSNIHLFGFAVTNENEQKACTLELYYCITFCKDRHGDNSVILESDYYLKNKVFVLIFHFAMNIWKQKSY